MLSRSKLLSDCSYLQRSLIHTSSVVQLRSKPVVHVKIEKHEFHKVIQYIRPEKLKPWDPRKTLDLQPLEKPDPNWLRHEFSTFADSLDQLPENDRRLFTVAFGARRDGMRIVLQNLLEKTRRHKYDNESLEFKVTWATWKIRNRQDLFRTHPEHVSGYLKSKTKELIEKRRKWLNQMRHKDYKRFEWIIEVLGLMFRLQPVYTRIERKASIDVLVAMYCNELRDKKMAEYKAELEKEKVPFLKMKLETLQEIRKEEQSIGLTSSVDDDIKATRKLLLQLEKTEDHLTIHPVNVSGTTLSDKSV